MYSVVLYGLAFLLSFIHALPVELEKRDVYNPQITNPNAETVWQVGSKQTVTWDTSDMPPDDQVTNPIGKIVLGWQETDSMNLQINSPLAEGFMVRDGHAEITVPDVPPRDNYIVVVFGDSGNSSPGFRIEGGSPGDESSPTPTASEPSSTSPLITDPIPIIGTTITGGLTEDPEAADPTPAVASETGTKPDNNTPFPISPTSSESNVTSHGTGTAEEAHSSEETQSSGWSIHHNHAKHMILGVVSFSLVLAL